MRTPNFHDLTSQLLSRPPLLLILCWATPPSFLPERQAQVLPLLPGHLHVLFALLAILSLLKYCQGFRFLPIWFLVPMFLSQRCLFFLTFQRSITLSTPLPYHFQSYTFSPLLVCLLGVVYCRACVFIHQNILCEGSYFVSFLHPISPAFSTPGILHNN